MQKVTITLDDEILSFVNRQAKGNRSSYINALLKEKYHGMSQQEMIAALQEDVNSLEYQTEIADWDVVVGDGIDAER